MLAARDNEGRGQESQTSTMTTRAGITRTVEFWGGNCVMDLVLDTGAVLDESMRTLRAQIQARPIVRPHGQADLWRGAGVIDVVAVPIVLSFDFADFPLRNCRRWKKCCAP
jgi:hypothetical protein